MKRLRWVFLAFVLVSVYCWLLSFDPSVPASRPSVTIRALGPTGSFWTRTNEARTVDTGQWWTFVVSNTGPVTAAWNPYVMVQTVTNQSQIHSHLFWPSRSVTRQRPLRPKQQAVITMPVPGDTNIVWQGTVAYWSPPTIFQSTLRPVTSRVRWLRYRFPDPPLPRSYSDGWHTTTNIAAKSSSRE